MENSKRENVNWERKREENWKKHVVGCREKVNFASNALRLNIFCFDFSSSVPSLRCRQLVPLVGSWEKKMLCGKCWKCFHFAFLSFAHCSAKAGSCCLLTFSLIFNFDEWKRENFHDEFSPTSVREVFTSRAKCGEKVNLFLFDRETRGEIVKRQKSWNKKERNNF